VVGVPAATTSKTDYTFVANEGQTVFSGSDQDGDNLVIADNAFFTDVYINGILMQSSNTSLYSSNTTALTFTEGVSNNDIITVRVFDRITSPGDVAKVGTPANNQVAVWTGDGTIEGDANLTWDGSILDINGSIAISTGLYDSANTLGTADQVLTSNGTSAIWQDAAGGGGLVLLETTTVTSNVNAVDFTLPAAYTRYKLIVQAADGSNAYPILRASLDGGNTFISSSDYGSYSLATKYDATSSSATESAGDSGASLSGGINDDLYYNVDIAISADGFSASGVGTGQISGTYYRVINSGFLTTATIPDALRVTFYSGSAVWETGTFSLYGYKESV
jgi:hypothetical protein